MQIAMIITAAVLALSTVLLLLVQAGLKKKFLFYEEELTNLRERLEDENLELPDLRVMIRIKDPLGLAQRESKLARVAASPAPNIVKRKCYEQVARETYDEFQVKGIETEVKVVTV